MDALCPESPLTASSSTFASKAIPVLGVWTSGDVRPTEAREVDVARVQAMATKKKGRHGGAAPNARYAPMGWIRFAKLWMTG
jgi:hypothetical protein